MRRKSEEFKKKLVLRDIRDDWGLVLSSPRPLSQYVVNLEFFLGRHSLAAAVQSTLQICATSKVFHTSGVFGAISRQSWQTAITISQPLPPRGWG